MVDGAYDAGGAAGDARAAAAAGGGGGGDASGDSAGGDTKLLPTPPGGKPAVPCRSDGCKTVRIFFALTRHIRPGYGGGSHMVLFIQVL